MLTKALREVFRTNLGIRKDERVLIFTDRPGRSEEIPEEDRQRWDRLKDIARLTEETGRSFAKEVLFTIFPARKGHGIEPPKGIWSMAFGTKAVHELTDAGLIVPILRKKASTEQMKRTEKIIEKHKEDAVDAVIALSNYSTSHTSFRDLLTRICGARYASMPLFDIDMFEGAMNVDWKALEKRTREVAALVNKAEIVGLKTPNGTNIVLSKEGRKTLADTGKLKQAGSFGNLPAGEVFFAPLEGTARGSLVLEWAPTRHLDSPVTLIVKDGSVVDIQGADAYADVLRKKLAERRENGNVAEVGIGTNERATRPDNILESEKILGTIHIALGDNSTFGGRVKTPFHQDFVFFRPTVVLTDSKGIQTMLMKGGKLRD